MKNFKFISRIVFAFVLIVTGLLAFTRTTFAVDTTLSPKDFTVWNQGGVTGYDAGFILNGGATFNGAQSIIVKLYSGSTLLQTNKAISGKITGTEFITPFDVFGTFDYANDGYFTNTRESEYGQTLAPTKVVATVVLSDGKIVTATSTQLAGDTTTIGVTPIIGQVLGVEKFNFTLKTQVGSKGNEVVELQKFLGDTGYYNGATDGMFGPMTKGAVIKLQTASGLKADGIVGSITRAILNK